MLITWKLKKMLVALSEKISRNEILNGWTNKNDQKEILMWKSSQFSSAYRFCWVIIFRQFNMLRHVRRGEGEWIIYTTSHPTFSHLPPQSSISNIYNIFFFPENFSLFLLNHLPLQFPPPHPSISHFLFKLSVIASCN